MTNKDTYKKKLTDPLEKFGGELIHGTAKISSGVVHHALSVIWKRLVSVEKVIHGCTIKGAEGSVGGGIGGAIFAPFVGPEAIPIGAADGAAGGCLWVALRAC